jgi:tRNA nucleotidyltransferase (CCA-adding enzyme)
VLGKGRDVTADLGRLDGLKAHVGRVMAAGAAVSLRDLAISGHDLLELGLRPGPIFGEILRALLDEVVEEPALNEREALLSRAREIAGLRGD